MNQVIQLCDQINAKPHLFIILIQTLVLTLTLTLTLTRTLTIAINILRANTLT